MIGTLTRDVRPATQAAVVVESEPEEAVAAACPETISRFEERTRATLSPAWREPAEPA